MYRNVRQIGECDLKIQTYLTGLPKRTLEKSAGPDTAESPEPKKKKRYKRSANAPRMDLRGEPERSCGADLTSIDGISLISAMTIVSEIGIDMSGFADENHFASWLGLARNDSISGGKPVKGPKRKVNSRVAAVLRMGATSLLNSRSYLGARYRHLWRNKEPRVAIKAMARHLAVLIYRLLTKGGAWVDRGAAVFDHMHKEREIAALHARAQAHGFTLMPSAAPQ
jgi:transposase